MHRVYLKANRENGALQAQPPSDDEEPFQYAYRTKRGTTTAMLMVMVQKDIIRAPGDNKVIMFVLIDLSAAFDTVNRERPLSTLHTIGITDITLA